LITNNNDNAENQATNKCIHIEADRKDEITAAAIVKKRKSIAKNET
jgi:hypothetical protein